MPKGCKDNTRSIENQPLDPVGGTTTSRHALLPSLNTQNTSIINQVRDACRVSLAASKRMSISCLLIVLQSKPNSTAREPADQRS